MKLFRHVAILYCGMSTESQASMHQADFETEDPDTYGELLLHHVLPDHSRQPRGDNRTAERKVTGEYEDRWTNKQGYQESKE